MHDADDRRSPIFDRPLRSEHSRPVELEANGRGSGVNDRFEQGDGAERSSQQAAGFKRGGRGCVGDDCVMDGSCDTESLAHHSTLP